ncbi:MAG: ChaN family lipoprotein [Proteobacteria bacterium]|nr:ChaN family lipoprotein [Pseudomonadota bacterium]
MSFFPSAVSASAVFLILMFFALPVSSTQILQAEEAEYDLSLSFTSGEQVGKLTGTAKLTILPGRRLGLTFPQMEVTEALLRDETGSESELVKIHDALILPATTTRRTLFLSYTKTVAGETDNLISTSGISLISNWHPLPDQPMRFRLTATLPEKFSAITESDTFPLASQGKTVSAVYEKPVTAIHFAAGPYTIHKRQVRENLFVHSMFFQEDVDLADGYLMAAVEYLRRYEREIGPYPYNHYVIVANRLPTGLGIPTFTLLGQTVLRLPFIKATSLGHEIVHSWFGNSVEVDYRTGNWCEGLTAFLSDHAYREEKGEGVADRNESITRYLSYIAKDLTIPLRAFTSASHTQAMAEVKRAVGYGRGALLFHELREKIGRPAFSDGLRLFYANNRDHKASWDDLQQSFATAAKTELNTFFNERLERAYIPELAIEDVGITTSSTGSVLSFTLQQKTDKPFTLVVPIRIRTLGGEVTVNQEIRELSTPLTISLDRRPTEFIIDPDHVFLRQLNPEELAPVWSRFMGAEKKLAVLAQESDRELYQPLFDSLSDRGLTVTTADKVSNKELSDNNLLFLGTDQSPARSLFGPPPSVGTELILDVRQNPLSPHHVAVLITSGDKQNTKAIIGRLSHYGKYSYLKFAGGRNTEKRITPVQSGLSVILEDLPMGGATSHLTSFEPIVEKLTEARVVYVGESHTNFADHLLQLRIIEALYKKNPLLAIGMEMFPASSQPALDRYTLGNEKMDERVFLKESNYYQAWSYDYRYFRDIFNFAKARAIPVIGLNLDRQIVSEVFRTGGTDSLSFETLASLPSDRDLDMKGYRERLSEMHEVHVQGNHGSGFAGGFLQAQALWDETMAQYIVDFLTTHPDHTMVVLAGAQHTRKDSGIPPRVARRLPVRQASVLNIYNESTPADLNQVADYFFLAATKDLQTTPKIGVILDTVYKKGQSFLKINQISPHGKAGVAGLIAGDRIEQINGMVVSDMADLYIAMLDSKKGDIIDIKISREENGQDRELQLQVELTNPPVSPPQP